jgi:hypothetical protein
MRTSGTKAKPIRDVLIILLLHILVGDFSADILWSDT